MENNNSDSFNPAQPFSTQAMPPQQVSSMSSSPQGSSSKITIVLFIILILVIISGGVVLYIVNQPSQSQINEPPYMMPPTQPPVEPTIIPTITPTVDEELLNLEDPIDATADLQDIDTDLQQL